MTDLIARVPSILEASTAANASQDEVAKAQASLVLAAEFAQFALEDYAHRPAVAALLDAIEAYQQAQLSRDAAGTALSDALRKEFDR